VELAPERHLVIALVSSHRIAVTVATLHPVHGEEPIRHKTLEVRWQELDRAGRAAALREAIDLACKPLQLTPHSIFIACSDPSMGASQVPGWAALGEDIAITEDERDIALDRARTTATSDDREQLDLVPTSWTVRSRAGAVDCDDPVGQVGHHLQCHALRITARRGLTAEFRQLAQDLGLELEGLIPQPVALYRGMAKAMRKAGTALVIDLGARHTTLVLRHSGRLAHLETHGFGGDDLSERIAEALGVEVSRAEELKLQVDIAQGGNGGDDGQMTIFDDLRRRQREIGVASQICADAIGGFFRERARLLREERNLLGQRGHVHLVGRAAAIGGLVPFLRRIFELEVVLGTGLKDADPGQELEGLLVAGLVKCAADRRIETLRRHGESIGGRARGIWAWLMEPLG
jgi:cell division ATPase FtsA